VAESTIVEDRRDRAEVRLVAWAPDNPFGRRWESRVNVVIDPEYVHLSTAVHWTGERAATLAALAIEKMANGIAIEDYKELMKFLARGYGDGKRKRRKRRFLLF